MGKKVTILIFLLLGLGIFSWVFLHKKAEDMPGRVLENSDAGEPATEAISSAELVSSKPRVRSLDENAPKLMDSATTFGKLNVLTAEMIRDEGARAEYMYHAASLCEGASFSKQRPMKLSSAAERSLSVYESFTKRFCKDFSGSSDEYLQQLYKASADSEVKQAEALQEIARDEEGKKLAIDRAKGIIEESDEALAVQAAARYLAANSVSLFGTKYVESGADYPQLKAAQFLAAQMLACDLGGGCGSEGYYTMVGCASTNTCRPGITLEQVWQKEHSSILYDLARRIYGGLKETRKSSP